MEKEPRLVCAFQLWIKNWIPEDKRIIVGPELCINNSTLLADSNGLVVTTKTWSLRFSGTYGLVRNLRFTADIGTDPTARKIHILYIIIKIKPVNHRSSSNSAEIRDGKFPSRELSDQIYYDTFITSFDTNEFTDEQSQKQPHIDSISSVFFMCGESFLWPFASLVLQAHISTIFPAALFFAYFVNKEFVILMTFNVARAHWKQTHH